jgi:REP-associated tyrosine transposase
VEHLESKRTFFVSAVTWGRRSLFQSDRMSELFLDVLFDYAKQGKYAIHEFVLMPNHFHLLITPGPMLALERCLQLIKGGFSFRAKKELQFGDEVWEKSFTNHRIRDAMDYANHRKYIWENPVRAGLVGSSEEYAYSSARPGFELAEAPQGLKPESLNAPVSHG